MALAREARSFREGGAYTKRILLSQGVVNTTHWKIGSPIWAPGKVLFFLVSGRGTSESSSPAE